MEVSPWENHGINGGGSIAMVDCLKQPQQAENEVWTTQP